MTATAETIISRGRRKAYRPMAARGRRKALEAALAAYARGDYFEAHELLEPAWLGSADQAERDLYGGIIKLSAAYVHGARRNPAGVAKNLRGARERLADGAAAGPDAAVDVMGLLADVDDRLAADRIDAQPPPVIRRSPR